VWDADSHTIAKTEMLKAYLNAWFRILGMKRRGQTILYVDGFAGPGFPAATGHQAKESGDVREHYDRYYTADCGRFDDFNRLGGKVTRDPRLTTLLDISSLKHAKRVPRASEVDVTVVTCPCLASIDLRAAVLASSIALLRRLAEHVRVKFDPPRCACCL
jgi:hypothetical protein